MMMKLIPGGKAMTTSNHFRSSPPAAHVRVLCISEPDRALNPLELQEDFVEICRSDFVEIYEKGEIDVRFGGNVVQVIPIKALRRASSFMFCSFAKYKTHLVTK